MLRKLCRTCLSGGKLFRLSPPPLFQIRLTLAKKDYVRALIQSRKINRKVLLDDDMQDIKVRAFLRVGGGKRETIRTNP